MNRRQFLKSTGLVSACFVPAGFYQGKPKPEATKNIALMKQWVKEGK